MRMVVIDDEPLVLRDTVETIKKVCPTDELLSFHDPYELLDYCISNPCEIAFLDIRMQTMTGIKLAEALKESCPKINIIFTTAYDNYYKDAMQLRASGYLLKPVSVEAVKNELMNLRYEPKRNETALLKITCFGGFQVTLPNGEDVRFERKRSKELFAYLVHSRGKECSIRDIAAALFEDEVYDKNNQIYMRKLISSMMLSLKDAGVELVVEKKIKSLKINTELVSCDLYEYYNMDIDVLDYRYEEYLPEYEWARIY